MKSDMSEREQLDIALDLIEKVKQGKEKTKALHGKNK